MTAAELLLAFELAAINEGLLLHRAPEGTEPTFLWPATENHWLGFQMGFKVGRESAESSPREMAHCTL